MKKSQTCMETRLLKNCLILLLPDMSFLEKKMDILLHICYNKQVAIMKFCFARPPMLQIKEKSRVTQAFHRGSSSKAFLEAVAVEECS
jgi:hypothetical protein